MLNSTSIKASSLEICDMDVYSNDSCTSLSYRQGSFRVIDSSNKEVVIDKSRVSGVGVISRERLAELVNSGLVYFKVNKRADNDYSISMSLRLLGGRPGANKDKDKDTHKESEKSRENSQPNRAPDSSNATLGKCAEAACVSSYAGTGAAIGGTIGDTPGAIVGGAIGSAIGTAACSPGGGGDSGGGDSGGDCSIM